MEIDNIIGIFQTYGIEVLLLKESSGSQVIRYTFKANSKEDLEKFQQVKEDFSLALKSSFSDVRVYIHPKDTLNIIVEVPKPEPEHVYLNEAWKEIEKEEYKLPLVLGRDLENKLVVKDITETGSILMAGHTSSGKSVFLNSLISTLLKTKTVKEVKLAIIDTKMGGEYTPYEGILQLPPSGVIDGNDGYNNLYKISKMISDREEKIQYKNNKQEFPYFIVIIEDLAYLMLSFGEEMEDLLSSLIEKGSTVGVYFILSTSKPNHKVLTKSLQKNINTRIAFALATKEDSNVILEEEGAETLLGNGDMLYKDSKIISPERIQAPYISTEEIDEIVEHTDKYEKRECRCPIPYCAKCLYSNCMDDDCTVHSIEKKRGRRNRVLFQKARLLIEKDSNITTATLQRELEIGYTKASELLQRLKRH